MRLRYLNELSIISDYFDNCIHLLELHSDLSNLRNVTVLESCDLIDTSIDDLILEKSSIYSLLISLLSIFTINLCLNLYFNLVHKCNSSNFKSHKYAFIKK